MSAPPPAGACLASEDLDRVGLAVLALARELAALSDRQCVLEALLERAGIASADAVDRFQPDAAVAERQRRAREQLIAAVTEALASPQ